MEKTKQPLSTFRLVAGIITIVLSVLVTFQSCAAGLSNALEENGESGGSAGVLLAVCFLVAGIVGIVTSYRLHPLHGSEVFLPEHHPDLSSFLLQSIFSDVETMLLLPSAAFPISDIIPSHSLIRSYKKPDEASGKIS